MFASALIIVFSLLLLVYWFRYTCLLVLRANTEEKLAARIATLNRLAFPDVQNQLRSEEELSLDPLHRALDNDYRILRYLQQHGADMGVSSVEQKMLALDYRVMRLWYRIARKCVVPQARMALQEMSSILAYFAHQMGQRVANQTEI